MLVQVLLFSNKEKSFKFLPDVKSGGSVKIKSLQRSTNNGKPVENQQQQCQWYHFKTLTQRQQQRKALMIFTQRECRLQWCQVLEALCTKKHEFCIDTTLARKQSTRQQQSSVNAGEKKLLRSSLTPTTITVFGPL